MFGRHGPAAYKPSPIHFAGPRFHREGATECGADVLARRVLVTSRPDAVTCKKCLAAIAAKKEA